MEVEGGTSSVKRVDVDTNSSELSASIASNTTIPHLEVADAERALDDNERRKEARKLKREAREKKKKKEQQRLEEKKARKEERRLKR